MGDTKTPQKSEDIFITNLFIKKVRHLKDIHIPLSKDKRTHLILTGKNGSGKTSVLKTLARALKNGSVLRSAQFMMVFNSANFQAYKSAGRFVLASYEAKRQAKLYIPEGLKKIDSKQWYEIQEQPGKQFIQHIVNLKAEKSFAKDDGDIQTVEKIDSWFDTFEDSLKEIFEDPSLTLKFERKNFNYKIFQEGKEPFDFNTLADGYAAIINVVTDLILRMENQKKKSYDVQGLVLIDELEAHLHIDLQKKIFPFLTRFFPKIQFIVTTHSPWVLNSIDNAVIYDLEKKLLVTDLSAYSYDGIVEGYFESDKYSQTIKNKLEKYEQLVNRDTRSEDEQQEMIDLRMYLEEISASLAPGLKAQFQQFELNRIDRPDD
jgi:predicted ATP-binding protein involved in virulence